MENEAHLAVRSWRCHVDVVAYSTMDGGVVCTHFTHSNLAWLGIGLLIFIEYIVSTHRISCHQCINPVPGVIVQTTTTTTTGYGTASCRRLILQAASVARFLNCGILFDVGRARGPNPLRTNAIVIGIDSAGNLNGRLALGAYSLSDHCLDSCPV